MKINNLNHIESAAQSVVGGSYYHYYYGPKAVAGADAKALAIGYRTFSNTHTNATAVAGVFSKSTSSSYAVAR